MQQWELSLREPWAVVPSGVRSDGRNGMAANSSQRRRTSSRRKWWSTIPRMSALLLLATALAACSVDDTETQNGAAGDSDSVDEAAASDGDAGADSGRMDVDIALGAFGVNSLDPAVGAVIEHRNILAHLYDTLLEIGDDGELLPGLATSWEISDDGLTYTFDLRRDVTFHDGSDLTADDVVFSMERYRDEGTTAGVAASVVANMDSITAVDDHTVELQLSSPQPDLLTQLGPHDVYIGILPKDYVESAGDDFEAQNELIQSAPVGTGPFEFVSHEPDIEAVFRGVEDHWRKTPAVDQLRLFHVPEEATRLAMLLNGEVQLTQLSTDDVEQVERSGLEIAQVSNSADLGLMVIGTNRPPAEGLPTTDARVRKALSLAIDRSSLVDDLLGGYGSLPETPFYLSPTSLETERYQEMVDELARFDPEEATQLLAEAGYPDGFELDFFTFPNAPFPQAPQFAEAIAAMWREIGVIVDLTSTDYTTLRPSIVGADINDDFNAGGVHTWGAPVTFNALSVLNLHYGENAPIPLENTEEKAELFAEIRQEIDQERRLELLGEFFARFDQEYLMIPLFSADTVLGYDHEQLSTDDFLEGYASWGRVSERLVPAQAGNA